MSEKQKVSRSRDHEPHIGSVTSGQSLKTCPFCGGKAVRQEIDESIDATPEDENFGGSFIECDDCGACSRVFFGEKEGLVESWNRRPSGPTGSEAYTAEGKEALDELKSSLTQAQARATAAEGERDEARADCHEADQALTHVSGAALVAKAAHKAAQQTITQLTRELETARKVLEPFAQAGRWYEGTAAAHLSDETWCSAISFQVGKLRAATSFLSSLSHQDEQG